MLSIMKKTKEELAKIYLDTLETIQIGGYENNDGNWVELTNPLKGSRFYQTTPAIKDEIKKFAETKIYVENIDTFQKAKKMGPACVVLNMASFIRPGGGVERGSRAQEEDLCRRSNLLQSLYAFSPEKCSLLNYNTPGRLKYPIPMYGGIYSPNVTVFRNALSYSYMNIPFTCSVISVAALRNPEIDSKTGELTEQGSTVMKGKIRAILRIAILNKHSKLVLGALGCGAYHNPPRHVARLFKEVLEEKEFKNSFSEICFAILEDGNSLKNQAGGNIKPFKEVFDYVYNNRD